MNVMRTVAIGVGGGTLVAWFSWAAPASRPLPGPRTRPVAVEQSGAALALEIARLHERLSPDVAPTNARNVFTFPARPLTTRARVELDEPHPAAVPAAPARAPALTLAGMAEEMSATGLVRTAIISGASGLYLVREGDEVTPRYRVEHLSADAAELRDVETGAAIHLGLR